MHDIIELNTYKQTIRLSLSRFVYWPVSIDYSIGISIDTLVETSTDYSVRISIDAHGQALIHVLNMLSLTLASLSSVRMVSGWDESYHLNLTILGQVLGS